MVNFFFTFVHELNEIYTNTNVKLNELFDKRPFDVKIRLFRAFNLITDYEVTHMTIDTFKMCELLFDEVLKYRHAPFMNKN